MSTSPVSPSHRTPAPRSKRKLVIALAAAVVVAAAGGYAFILWREAQRPKEQVSVFAIRRGPLTISVTESGTIQNRDLVIVKSEVEGRASLLKVEPEGNTVEKGQLLAELDSSTLVDQRTQQTITVLNAEASFIRARENLAMTKSQSDSDVSKAELDVSFAEMDRKKYEDGDYPQELRQSDADITIATEELQRAKDQLEWSTRLAAEKFITRTELQGDELAAKRADLNLQLAEARKKLLMEFTYRRRIEELKSNVDQTAAAFERATRKATADIVQAEADLKAKDSEFTRQKARLEKYDEQIKKCKIYAPVAGMVVYATTGKANFRGNNEPLAEGQEIRERQELIYLPTTASMMAQVMIHESSLRKIRKNLPVRITVDAVPGKSFTGRVGKIALLPDAQSMWMNPDLKLYGVDVVIDGDATDLRAGMTCKTEIIVAQYDDALYAPVQSVVRVKGKATVYLPGNAPREVEIGLDNNQMVHLLSGVEEGENVLMAPPLGPSTAPLAEQEKMTMPPPEKTNGKAPAAVTPTTPAPADGNGGAAVDAPASGNGGEAKPPAETGKRPDFRSMTPEEQQKYLDSLTPEQKAAMQKARAARKGRGGAGANGGAPAAPSPAPDGP